MKTVKGEWVESNLFISENGVRHKIIPMTYINVNEEDFPFQCFINCEVYSIGKKGMGETLAVYAYTKLSDLNSILGDTTT